MGCLMGIRERGRPFLLTMALGKTERCFLFDFDSLNFLMDSREV